jgi:hypothetical protein
MSTAIKLLSIKIQMDVQPHRQRTGKTMAFFTLSPPSLNFAFASALVVFPAGHAER